jgi:uncharacterized protein
MRNLLFGVLGLALAPQPSHDGAILATQISNSPQIIVSSHGEARLTPDRASIHISVQTRAATASAAAAENAKRQQAVVTAIRTLGIAPDQISTANYSVNPEYRYDPNQAPTVIGYVVTNTVVVDVRDLAKVPRVIDTSLGSGANMIEGLQFYASNSDSARREALAAAVAKARADAEVVAKAARGSLGSMLEATVGSYAMPPRPMYTMSKAAGQEAADTPISPGQQTITVDVTTRWVFVAAQ